MMDKLCCKCSETKSVSEFHKNKNTKDGYNYYCKECRSADIKEKRKTITRVTEITIKSKICPKCKTEKDTKEFHRSSTQPDGLNVWCKDCKKISGTSLSEMYKKRDSIDIPHEKTCCKCKETKDKTEFVLSRRNKTGLASECKDCMGSYGKKYRENLCSREIPIDYRDITKKCRTCKELKTGDEFCIDKSRKNFLTGECKKCISNNFTVLMEYIKNKKIEMGGKCVTCYSDDLEVLEFDHRIGEKTKNVTQLRSFKAIDEEAKKCQLLCIRCHRKKSVKDTRERSLGQRKDVDGKLRQRNKEFINKIKLEIGRCQHCDLKIDVNDEYDLSAFDFDHIDPLTKVKEVTKMSLNKFSINRIQAEIDKCQLLCCICHKKKTIRSLRSD